jgi:hypothetical protein
MRKVKKKSSTSFSDDIQRTWKRTSEWTVDNVDALRIEIFPETDKSLLPPRDDIDYKDWDDYYYINKIIIPYLDNLELDEAEDPEYPFISRLSRFREMGRNANVSPLQDILTFGGFEFNDENITCRFLGRPKLTMAYKRTINSNPDYGVYTRSPKFIHIVASEGTDHTHTQQGMEIQMVGDMLVIAMNRFKMLTSWHDKVPTQTVYGILLWDSQIYVYSASFHADYLSSFNFHRRNQLAERNINRARLNVHKEKYSFLNVTERAGIAETFHQIKDNIVHSEARNFRSH